MVIKISYLCILLLLLGIVAKVLNENEALVITDVKESSLYDYVVDSREAMFDGETSCVILFPIRASSGEVLGVLELINPKLGDKRFNNLRRFMKHANTFCDAVSSIMGTIKCCHSVLLSICVH